MARAEVKKVNLKSTESIKQLKKAAHTNPRHFAVQYNVQVCAHLIYAVSYAHIFPYHQIPNTQS